MSQAQEIGALFAALVLIEGFRRIPAGSLVARGSGWWSWRPVLEPEPRDRRRLVSWWPPLAPALVLPPLGGAATLPNERLTERLRLARRAAPWLGTGGGVTLAALVLGLPLLSSRLGAAGFAAGVAVVLGAAVLTAIAGARAIRRLDGRGPGWTQALAWCWPFATGRVLEAVYQAACAGASPAQALRALANDRIFGEWARRRAYDVVLGGQTDPDLQAAADDAALRAIVRSEPPLAADGKTYCPRCAAVWIAAREVCPECGVPVVPR